MMMMEPIICVSDQRLPLTASSASRITVMTAYRSDEGMMTLASGGRRGLCRHVVHHSTTYGTLSRHIDMHRRRPQRYHSATGAVQHTKRLRKKH